MTEFDRVGSGNTVNLRGFHRFLQVCEKRSQSTRNQKMECLHSDVLLHCYSKVLGFRLPVYPVNKNKVLIPIEV